MIALAPTASRVSGRPPRIGEAWGTPGRRSAHPAPVAAKWYARRCSRSSRAGHEVPCQPASGERQSPFGGSRSSRDVRADKQMHLPEIEPTLAHGRQQR